MGLDQYDFILAQFVDINGSPKTKLVPVRSASQLFAQGVGFAGFAVKGMGLEPHESEYIAKGDESTLRPMTWMPRTGVVQCRGMVDDRLHPIDSRNICERISLEFKEETGSEVFTGLEPEFFLLRRNPNGEIVPALEDDTLDKPCYDYRGLLGVKDFLFDLNESLSAANIDVYQIDHEDSNGQYEINFRYDKCLNTADKFTFFKMALAGIADKHNYIPSLMPKPFSSRTGNGMHLHISIGDSQLPNRFSDNTDARGMGLSEEGYHFLSGILHHAESLTAISCPSINSYKRLIAKGSDSGATWAPAYISYGYNNRTAMVRIVDNHLEIRTPDSMANPYLLTAAVIISGLDGIRNRYDLPKPINENLYSLPERQLRDLGIKRLPRDLKESLASFRNNRVFYESLGEEFCDTFVKTKEMEWHDFMSQVSPWEIERYLRL